MIKIHKAANRGRTQLGWLDSWHSFSFGDFHDRTRMSFSSLRVINEDIVSPGAGFGMHPHRDMEIVTFIISGTLEHKDSMGNGEKLEAGWVQAMSAGSGVQHSEFNPVADVPVHLYQIWLMPAEKGLEPSYQQRDFSAERRADGFKLLAGPPNPAGQWDTLAIHQDARLWHGLLGARMVRIPAPLGGRRAWVQVVRGNVAIRVDGQAITLATGDGAAIEGALAAEMSAGDGETAEVLLFDLP